MAATFDWQEDNGAATGSPAKGTTRVTGRTERNYKNIDDSTTAYTSSPITAGNNSYTKYQFGRFTGTFNQILNCKWSAHTSPSGALATGLALHGKVSSTYTTPATTVDSGIATPTDFTTAVAIGSGLSVNFSTTGPEAASPTATLTAAGYTQYLASQLQTTVSASPGDMPTVTETLQWTKSLAA
jgi:hypothetical protein